MLFCNCLKFEPVIDRESGENAVFEMIEQLVPGDWAGTMRVAAQGCKDRSHGDGGPMTDC